MFETLDKLLLAGLGAVTMTREHAEKIFDEYVEKGKAEKTGRTGFVKEIMDLTEKNRKNLEKLVSEQVNKAIGQLNLATSDDIKRIEKKLNQLLSKE
jgi:polyhydroxyalkanoate synthesis regulator phasin